MILQQIVIYFWNQIFVLFLKKFHFWCSFFRSNSGPHQENHNSNDARSNFIITSPQNEAHKMLLTKRGQQTCQQNVIERNYEDQPYAVRTLCPIWQPCAARSKDLLSFYNGPTFMVLVKLGIACFRLHYWRATTPWPRNAERSKSTAR